jgi:hypothetical protein
MTNLSGTLERAVRAARRGDVSSLEVELRNLRRLPVYGRGSIALVLHSMARSAAMHPAGRAELKSKAS